MKGRLSRHDLNFIILATERGTIGFTLQQIMGGNRSGLSIKLIAYIHLNPTHLNKLFCIKERL